jgi:hypothetical protein
MRKGRGATTSAHCAERRRLVNYGLCKVSNDLIGLRQVLIGPEHLGHALAVETHPGFVSTPNLGF